MGKFMLQIYDTLRRTKLEFKSLIPNTIKIYGCGVTVYDFCHLGHGRTYTALDVIIRYLKWRGFTIIYVRNITDIDDKIIQRARENKEQISSLTARFITAMHEDFSALNLLSPTHEPRATHYVTHMITMIEQLLARKHAYVASNGDIYFDVGSYADYGCLSHHDLTQLESGVRIDVVEAKQHPHDFVLWKLAKAGEPTWNSSWGLGRPSWHIECSAMAYDILGAQFDLHAGGRDLIFPHHENELAQARAATNAPFANYWLHMGFLQMDTEKMSKSLGNIVKLRDAIEQFGAEVVRLFFISSHYRSPLIYNPEALIQTKQALNRLYTALRFFPATESALPSSLADNNFAVRFIAAMDDDFNTPVALAVLFELAHEINRLRISNPDQATTYAQLLRQLGNCLGILTADSESFFQNSAGVDSRQINALIQAREEARRLKNWAEADRIRDQLTNLKVVIEDSSDGSHWRIDD